MGCDVAVVVCAERKVSDVVLWEEVMEGIVVVRTAFLSNKILHDFPSRSNRTTDG